MLEDWWKDGAKLPERRVKLIGTVSPGSDLREGSTWFRMYEPPLPAGLEGTGINGTGRNGWFGTEVLELGHEDGKDTVIIRDKLRKNIEPYFQVPVALTEDQPIQTKSLEDALAALASGVAAGVQRGTSGFPRHPALDLIRRVPPRLASGAPLPAPGEGPDRFIDAITEAVGALDHSYVAVQGPPGTGKTHVGSHVIARLVDRGWKVGVVGQSHAVVENLLKTAVTKAGVDPDRVAKEVKHTEPLPWEQRSAKDVARLLSSPGGALIGGTAWTMTGANVPAGLAGPAGDRRGRAVLAGQHPGRGAGQQPPAAARVIRSSCRRSARARTPSPWTSRPWAGFPPAMPRCRRTWATFWPTRGG